MRKREVNVLQETQPKGNGRSMVGREVPASLRDTSEPNITEISGLSTLRFSVGPLSLQYHEDLIKPLFSTLTPEFSNYMSMVSSGFTDLCFSNLIPPCSKSWTWLFPPHSPHMYIYSWETRVNEGQAGIREWKVETSGHPTCPHLHVIIISAKLLSCMVERTAPTWVTTNTKGVSEQPRVCLWTCRVCFSPFSLLVAQVLDLIISNLFSIHLRICKDNSKNEGITSRPEYTLFNLIIERIQLQNSVRSNNIFKKAKQTETFLGYGHKRILPTAEISSVTPLCIHFQSRMVIQWASQALETAESGFPAAHWKLTSAFSNLSSEVWALSWLVSLMEKSPVKHTA